jgi:hypothetical protein
VDAAHDVIARGEALLWRRLPDRLLVLPARAGAELITMSGTAIDVWDELEQPQTVHELVTRLAVRFAAPASVVESDVVPLVEGLERQGLLTRTASP